MSISVTENVTSVTDVMVLLSSLGFDTGTGDAPPEVVIDKFDQWTNPNNEFVYASPSGCGIFVPMRAAA